MKINEYNQMMQWLTRPDTKIKETPKETWNRLEEAEKERQQLAKGTKAKTAAKKTSVDGTLKYINDMNIVYGDKKVPKADAEAAAQRVESYEDQYNKYFNKKSPKFYKNKTAKIPMLPPKPDVANGHSTWSTDDWLETIDQGGWVDDRKAGILEYELSNEYWQNQFQNYQNNGGVLNFNQFMEQELNKKVSNEINKRVKDKQRTEGIAAILGVNPDKI